MRLTGPAPPRCRISQYIMIAGILFVYLLSHSAINVSIRRANNSSWHSCPAFESIRAISVFFCAAVGFHLSFTQSWKRMLKMLPSLSIFLNSVSPILSRIIRISFLASSP